MMNRKLLAAAVAGVVSPMTAQAVDFAVSGAIDRAIRFADNGNGSDVQHVSGPYPTHFAFSGSAEAMPGIVAGGRIEAGWGANSAGTRDVDAPDKAPDLSYRHSYMYVSGAFGRVTLGWTNPAGRSAMFGSHNGAWAGTEYSVDHTSSISVLTTDDESSGYSIWDFMPSVNWGRANVLRYNSPSIGPVTFAASLQKDGNDPTDQMWAFEGRVSQEVGAASVIGRVGIVEDALAISGGMKFANGTSINAAWGTDERKAGQDYEDVYVNLSHEWGNLSLAIDYRTADDSMTNLEGRKVGLGANYALGEGVNVYAGFHNYSFDAPDMDLENVNSFHIGTSVSF